MSRTVSIGTKCDGQVYVMESQILRYVITYFLASFQVTYQHVFPILGPEWNKTKH